MTTRDAQRVLGAAMLALVAACAAPPVQEIAGPNEVTVDGSAGGPADDPVDEERLRAMPVVVQKEGFPLPIMDHDRYGFFMFDQLEVRSYDGADDTARWDAQGWYGDDYDRLWVRTEGESTIAGAAATDAEFQLAYSRLIAPFWDFQVGMRYDVESGPGADRSRWFGVVGLQGFARYRFDVDPMLFVSEDGDVSARFTGTTDWLITQRLILQPRLETEIAVQDVEEFGVGSGFEYVELGLRLRYEFVRDLAPYVGLEWEEALGATADLARADGEDISALAYVLGIRIWL